MIKSLVVLLWTALLVVPFSVRSASAENGTPLRILFVGNSLIYYYDMHHVLQQLAASAGKSLEVDAITAGGSTLEDHWNRGEVQEALQRGGWDYVVLQERSTRPVHEPEAFYQFARLFDAQIKNAGARTVLFQNWTLRDSRGDMSRLNTVYSTIANELGAIVAPLGQAWENARRSIEDLELYLDDRHPNFEGTYLGASVFYATLFGEDPAGLDPLELGEESARFLQSAAWRTVSRTSGLTELTGEYFDDADLTSLVMTRADTDVDFDWGEDSPDPSLECDTFSVRWTGQLQPGYSEEYTFITTSDNGVRLWVDGQLVIDNWTDHPPAEDSGAITLEAGVQYDIRLEFYENDGGAAIKLEWESASQDREVIPQISARAGEPEQTKFNR